MRRNSTAYGVLIVAALCLRAFAQTADPAEQFAELQKKAEALKAKIAELSAAGDQAEELKARISAFSALGKKAEDLKAKAAELSDLRKQAEEFQAKANDMRAKAENLKNLFDQAGSTIPRIQARVQELLAAGKSKEAMDLLAAQDAYTKSNVLTQVSAADASKFWSMWGPGFIVNLDGGGHKPVKTASVINGVVRVDEEEDVKYGLGIEVHKMVWGTEWTRKNDLSYTSLSLGPYVAILPSANEPVDAIGVGLLCSLFSRDVRDEKAPFALNLGIGFYVDPSTRILADGFKDGKPLPEGETDVRFRSVLQSGVEAVISFSYGF
jgi:hypothetical protein